MPYLRSASASRCHRTALHIRFFTLLALAATALTACHSRNEGVGEARRAYSLAGSVSGLSASGLVLQNNGSDDLTLAANATSFQFVGLLVAGGDYNVTVSAQPTGLTCTVSHGAGANVNAPVSNVSITCNPVTYTIAGTITGLTSGGLVLQNNGADNLIAAANATTFEFSTPVAAGSGYSVTPFSQPAGLTCTVSHGMGTHVNANVSSISVTCSASSFTVGGTVTGLTAGGLVLQDNGGDNLAIAANATAFAFAAPVAYGSAYAATVLTQPAGQICSVSAGAGVAVADVTAVKVTCSVVVRYTVTPSSGANGSIAPNVVSLVNSGGSQGYTATPNSGYAVNQWLVDGVPVQTGGAVYTLANITANHTIEATFGQATLTPSVGSLTLAVNDTALDAALTGSARQITITNTGTIPAANVSVASSGFPAGTMFTSTCGGTLAAASSCMVTVTPGATATSGCTTGTAPTNGAVTVSSDDAPDSVIGVLVLGYGCVYQGGYVYSVDDTTPSTGSIGGKVAAQSDQATAFSPGIIWSSDSSGNFDGGVSIWGIDETSTSSSPSPNASSAAAATQYSGQSACNGSADGACDTNNINVYYTTSASPPVSVLSYYAAGLCAAAIGGYTDWYLPSICELGPDAGSHICTAQNAQNMTDDLPMLVNSCTGAACLSGYYWSATEYSGSPQNAAWIEYFAPGGGNQIAASKANSVGVRCSRAITN